MFLLRGILKTFLPFVFCSTSPLFSQIASYPTQEKSFPKELLAYFEEDSLINLEHLRSTCNLLTNPNIRFKDGYLLPARKKAFIRYVKTVSEQLELGYLLKKKRDSTTLDLVYQLEWMRLSFLQKAESNSTNKISFHKKKQLFFNTLKSKNSLRIRIPKSAFSGEYESIVSPFYKELIDSVCLEDRFDILAKKKKINAQNQMVVLADQLSKGGSAPKFEVLDLDFENKWIIKWGDEVHTDIFCSRMFAAIGYDVDHPYFYTENLILVFDGVSNMKSSIELIDSLKIQYGIDIKNYLNKTGKITDEMAKSLPSLTPFIGKPYAQFKECSLEARPDRVKRLGSFMPYSLENASRRELKGSLLAHIYIDNWDIKQENTALTLVNKGNKNYRLSAIYSDLGTSMGVHISWLNQDFKVGLVNELPWEAVKIKGRKLVFTSRINSLVDLYKKTDYEDLRWMAFKIAAIDSVGLRSMIEAAHWPPAISELYFHKMAARRASIVKAFDILDPHPIGYTKQLTIYENGKCLVKKGKLLKAADLAAYPISYINFKGRMRNYGQ
jgi:hypothetical protein